MSLTMKHLIQRGLGAFVIASGATLAVAAASGEELLKPTASFAIDRDLSGKHPSKPAKDLSGIACRAPDAAGSRLCAVVNDEGSFAQLATLRGRNMIVGDVVRLIGDRPLDLQKVSGRQPEVSCPGGPDAASKELDGEGVAYAAPEGTFYVVGSHGCSRKNAIFKLSSFLLARFAIGADGQAGAPELTYRLSEALRRADPVGAFFGKSLDAAAQGLNIEGIAVAGDDLLVGLRAPSLDGVAFILRARIADLFAPGPGDMPVSAHVQQIVALRPHAGIRDLTMLPDGRLLVLWGPAQEQCDTPFGISLVAEPRPGPQLASRELGVLDNVFADDAQRSEWNRCMARTDHDAKDGRAKAEGIAAFPGDDGETKVLVLYDGLPNGGRFEYTLKLP